MKKHLSIHYIISALTALFAICAVFGLSTEARAADFVLNAGIEGLYWQDNVASGEYRSDYDLGVFSFSIEPGVRFADLYSLGLEVSIGGTTLGDSKYKSACYNGNKSCKELGAALDVYLTNRFIYAGESYDLWAEIGLGIHTIFSDSYYNEEGKFENVNLWMGARLKLGMTYYITDFVGVGLHGVAGYYILESFSFGGGLHTSFRF